MIYAYVGEFRSGKTLSMVWDCIQAMYRGVRVVSNFPIELEYDPFLRKKKHLKAECYPEADKFIWHLENDSNCIFAIDETGIYFPNYFWHELSKHPDILVKFHQVEHYYAHIWYTTQKFKQSASRLRELTNRVAECKKIPLGITKIFINNWYEPDVFNGVPTPEKRKNYFLGRRIIWPSDFRRASLAYDTRYHMESSLVTITK